MSELKQPVEGNHLDTCPPDPRGNSAGGNSTGGNGAGSIGARNSASHSSDAAHEKTARMLAALWVRSTPVIAERVALIRAATMALAATALDDFTRTQAEQAAHKLAGVLGTFGFPEGTDAARRIEQMLLPDARPTPAALPQMEADLHTLELLLPAR